MPVLLGGETAWRVRTNGEIVSSYQWMNGEPAMFLYRRGARVGAAFVLPLKNAYLWANNNGHPNLDHAIPSAETVAKVLGLSADRSSITRIIDVILDGLPDLVAMPPQRPIDTPKAPTVGEMAIKLDGQTIAEFEVPDLPA